MELERFLVAPLKGETLDTVKQLVTARLAESFRECSNLLYLKENPEKMSVEGRDDQNFKFVVTASFAHLDKTYVRFDYSLQKDNVEFSSSTWRPPLQWVRHVQTDYSHSVNHKDVQKLLLQYFPLWPFTRLLFLARYKNDLEECPLAMLPPEMLVKVNGYL